MNKLSLFRSNPASLNLFSFLVFATPLSLVFGTFITELLLFILIFYILFNRKKNLYFLKDYKKSIFIFFIFYFVIIISSFFSLDQSTSLLKSISYIRFFFLSIIIYLFFEDKKNFNSSVIFFTIFFSILFFDSLFQFFYGTNIIGYKYTLSRVTSFFNDEHVLGSYISRFYPVILSLIFFSKINYKKQLVIYISIISLIMIYLSSERTAFILFIISSFFFIFLKNYRDYLAFLLIFVFTLFIFKGESYDRLVKHTLEQIYNKKENKINLFSERHENHIKVAWKIFLDHKLFGSGIKTFRKICSDKKYSDELINYYFHSSRKIYAPVNGEGLVLHDPQTLNNYIFIFKNEIPPKIKFKISQNKIKKNPTFIMTTEQRINYSKVKNYVQDYNLPKNLPKKFVSFEVKHLNTFRIIKGDILFRVPDDQFIDGCNTHPHHTFIQLLTETGIFSFFIVLSIFTVVCYNLIKNLLKSIRTKNEYYYGMMMLNVSFFINLFPFVPSGSFYNNFLSFIYFFPIGIYYSMLKK